MDKLDRAEAARLMGMKEREIRHLEGTDDGVVVTTHDGVRTLIDGDGGMTVVSAPAPALRDPSTGAVIRPATPESAVPQPDGTLSERAPVGEGELCEACRGTGRKDADVPADLVTTTPAPEVTSAQGGDHPDPEPDKAGEVPDGDAKVVLDWVGDDRERAARALRAEQQRDQPRSTLVSKLERLARP